MNNKGQLGIGMIVMLAVAVILGAVFIGSIASEQNVMTELQSSTNESFNLTALGCYASGTVNVSNSACNVTIANAPSGWKTDRCPISSVTIINNSGSGTLTLTTDYTIVASTGVIAFKNTTATSNVSLGEVAKVSYSYCADGYNPDSSSRGIARLFTIFFALIVLSVAVLGIKEWLK